MPLDSRLLPPNTTTNINFSKFLCLHAGQHNTSSVIDAYDAVGVKLWNYFVHRQDTNQALRSMYLDRQECFIDNPKTGFISNRCKDKMVTGSAPSLSKRKTASEQAKWTFACECLISVTLICIHTLTLNISTYLLRWMDSPLKWQQYLHLSHNLIVICLFFTNC